MNTATLPSIFLLTLLLAVGLFFFIRASVKARLEQVKLIAQESEEALLRLLQQYFEDRAYRVTAVDPAINQVTFQGFVRPSWFLAIFLTLLAACGTLCLSLVLSLLYPNLTSLFLGLVILAPTAGFFYWKKAGRTEQVALKIESVTTQDATEQSLITVTAHRDELAQLQKSIDFKLFREDAHN
ncbi:MAG: cofactor assembly of complex C subunit B [Symploca sp. SIO3C6]|uniref:Cofactor assembly of complex C subunit B n=1 Tax=Symploca sp. SIO1C4 TaxID=2607765 RepID=A0A6B3NB13_9CYAN|nr:cofactor assembly of complex C subunit B [Symploca sp. SIO3C6]NER27214.1 cofactor assembly of complex C subunit B [Symploca sp. SIO1C4]NET06167.1 cofactor assembly of complex C subunit B [Symploca sp. SIO2B6]